MPDDSVRRVRASLRPSTGFGDASLGGRPFLSAARTAFTVEFQATPPDSLDSRELADRVRSLSSTAPALGENTLRSLLKYEQAVFDWLERSPTHVEWFAKDPLGALRAANLGIDAKLLDELKALGESIGKR